MCNRENRGKAGAIALKKSAQEKIRKNKII